jgi:hypothetical protein
VNDGVGENDTVRVPRSRFLVIVQDCVSDFDISCEIDFVTVLASGVIDLDLEDSYDGERVPIVLDSVTDVLNDSLDEDVGDSEMDREYVKDIVVDGDWEPDGVMEASCDCEILEGVNDSVIVLHVTDAS